MLAVLSVLAAQGMTRWRADLAFSLVVVALGVSLFYTPDYLHLTTVGETRPRWAIKIRSRIAGAVLILGLLLATSAHGRIAALLAAVWLIGMMWLARRISPRWLPGLFLITDWLLIMPCMFHGGLPVLVTIATLASSVHLAVVICSRLYWQCAVVGLATGGLLLFMAWGHQFVPALPWAGWAMIAVAGFATAWLVSRAERHNAQNIVAAMAELTEFTGYSPDKVRQLWETSGRQLAENWTKAAIPENDRERMAEWYRLNSELYLFNISAYNLTYKRIMSNLRVIRFARGACLDYGAGNGEILLELARRGHPAVYFDVDGVTMRFARYRAQRQNLKVQFTVSKEQIREAAALHGFDTVFAFDVLEHMPDLPGELDFLSSLLRPGGVMVFDVPAGSTKAHPMHLNHNLNVFDYMGKKGLLDRRAFYLRIPFRNEEKYVFEVPR